MVAAWSCSRAGDEGEHDQPIASLVRADEFSRLVFELDSVAGTEPSAAVHARVLAQASFLVDKPQGISIVTDETLAPRGSDHAWTDAELHEVTKESANLPLGERQVRVHIVTLDGYAASDSETFRTLGLSWSNRTIVLFKQSIQWTCRQGVVKHASVKELCDQSEALIWLHEFGHLLGLVDMGLPMQEPHADAEHAGHDRNPDCIMYWLFHRVEAVKILRTRFNAGKLKPLSFDRQCLNDLAALRTAPGDADAGEP